MENKEQKLRKIICPVCSKATNVAIMKLDGVLRYSLKCRSCKTVSEVEIRDIQ